MVQAQNSATAYGIPPVICFELDLSNLQIIITDVDAAINPPTNPGAEIGEGEPKLLWPQFLDLFV